MKEEKTTQEQIEDKILKEILAEDSFEKRYKLIQQLDLMSRALYTMKERDEK